MKQSWKLVIVLVLVVGVGSLAGFLALAEISIGKSHTSSQFTTTASSSTPQHAILCARRVLINQEGSDPLLDEVARQLASSLTNVPPVERVEVARHGATFPFWPKGQPGPDLFLRLEKVASKTTGIFSKTTANTIVATLATAPWMSSHHYQDDTSPPVVTFQWRARLEQTRVTKGVGLNRPSVIAAEIAEQLFKGASNQLASFREKHPIASPELDVLIPSYQATPRLQPVESLKGILVCSGPRLLSPNETFWLIPAQTNPVPALAFLQAELVKEGWKVQSSALTNTLYLRLRKERTIIESFAPSAELGSQHPENLAPAPLVVRYREAVDPQKLEALLETLAQTLPLEEVLPFHQNLSRDHRVRFWEKVKASPAPSAGLLAGLADYEFSTGRPQEARRFAALARLMEYEVNGRSDIDSRLDHLEKKIGKIQAADPSAQDLAALGFLVVNDQKSTHSTERALGEPFRLVLRKPNQEMRLISLTVTQVFPSRPGAYALAKAERLTHGRSMSHSQINLAPDREHVCHLDSAETQCRARLRLADHGKRVRLVLEADGN